MKKLLTLAVAALFVMSASAQLYVGGSLGLGFGSVKNDNGDKLYSTTTFSLFPEIGYSLSEKMDLGISFGFGMTSLKPDGGDALKTNAWEVAPYLRYSLVEFGKFKVMAKASLYVAGDETIDEVKTTSFGLSVIPVLGYGLSDNFILLANLNCFGLGVDNTKVKDGNSTFGLGLGANTNNVLNTGDFTIGFAYIF